MKATNIKVGNVYDVKVGKNTTPVRIMKLVPTGGWEAVTLSGNKTIVIKSADRLVGIHKDKPTKATTAAQGATGQPQPGQPADSAQPPATGEPEPTGTQIKRRAARVLDRMSKPLDGKRLTALDAAAKVLAEANAPLNCKQMVEAMMAKDYWKPSHAGKTPANTLHAAIGAEIKKKGAAARFEKVGRGQFGLCSSK